MPGLTMKQHECAALGGSTSIKQKKPYFYYLHGKLAQWLSLKENTTVLAKPP